MPKTPVKHLSQAYFQPDNFDKKMLPRPSTCLSFSAQDYTEISQFIQNRIQDRKADVDEKERRTPIKPGHEASSPARTPLQSRK